MFKTIIFLITLNIFVPQITFANTYKSLNYVITPKLDASIPYINVELDIYGEILNSIVLNLPYEWAGVKYHEQIKNVKLGNLDHKIFLDTGYQQLQVTLPKPIKSFKISYNIYQKPGDPSDPHETIIRKDLIHSTGYGLFLTPQDLAFDQNIQSNIIWNEIPDDWKTISSFGIKKSVSTNNLEKLLYSIFAAGNLRIQQIGDYDHPLYLSLYHEFIMKDELISAQLNEIINTQKSFFNDYDFPYRAISLIERMSKGPMEGTMLTNIFTAHMPKNVSKKDFYILLAHENFHNWTAGKISCSQELALNYWWSEGFTDYYARVLALRSGGITTEQFIEEFNEILKSYYLSPVINKDNNAIKKDFWNDQNIQKLPYLRGFVFAVYLNHLIKSKDASKSLDDIMLDIFKVSKHQKFSMKLFKNIAKNYVGFSIKTLLDDFIVKGKTIHFDKLMNILPLELIIDDESNNLYQLKSNLKVTDIEIIKDFFSSVN